MLHMIYQAEVAFVERACMCVCVRQITKRYTSLVRYVDSSDSGITSAVGEQCLTNAGSLGLVPEPCLEAIAAGDGREVMKFDADCNTHVLTSIALSFDVTLMC